MDISEVRVKLVNNPKDRLKAFCSITLENDFVIRDLKIIDGTNGTFVAMPSRKLAERCTGCGHKNHLRARFCNECGKQIDSSRSARMRRKLHADIAHPINSACRERIQGIVVDAYKDEIEKSKQPGYKPAVLDDFEDFDDFDAELIETDGAAPAPAPRREKDETSYDDLIADLKRDAQKRRDERSTPQPDRFAVPEQAIARHPAEPMGPPAGSSQFGAGLV
jgi:stage V sporulation protein G